MTPRSARSARSADRRRRLAGRVILALGIVALAAVGLLLRLSVVTDHLVHALVKDPPRSAPAGAVIVAPADGTVLYVRRVESGIVPEVVKRGVRVPIVEHLKLGGERRLRDGWLIGIYMNTFGVHVNRIPNTGRVKERIVFNGPHMDMTAAETKVILTGLLPGMVTLRKLLGLAPFAIEDDADFVLKSARETLVVEDERGVDLYVVRIADYYVGRILTWVREGQAVGRGDKLGMISWGSQTDLFIEDSPGLTVRAAVGDYVYGGETVLAAY
jgi:phosphatidylserine decarboxylase